jgi:hypothetical protein
LLGWRGQAPVSVNPAAQLVVVAGDAIDTAGQLRSPRGDFSGSVAAVAGENGAVRIQTTAPGGCRVLFCPSAEGVPIGARATLYWQRKPIATTPALPLTGGGSLKWNWQYGGPVAGPMLNTEVRIGTVLFAPFFAYISLADVPALAFEWNGQVVDQTLVPGESLTFVWPNANQKLQYGLDVIEFPAGFGAP